MRDTHPKADKDYWDGLLEFQRKSIARRRGIYTAPGTGQVDPSKEQLSAGRPVADAVDMARASVIDLLPKYLADFPPGSKNGAAHTGASRVHRWLATAVLCRATSSELSDFYEGLDLYGVSPTHTDEPDRIWTIYRNKLLGEDTPLPDNIYWPEAYGTLAQATSRAQHFCVSL